MANLRPRMLICWDINSKENDLTAATCKQIGGDRLQVLSVKIDLSCKDEIYQAAMRTKAEVRNMLDDDSAYCVGVGIYVEKHFFLFFTYSNACSCDNASE